MRSSERAIRGSRSEAGQGTGLAARVTGTGAAFPATRVTNHELCSLVSASDEWIQSRTGVRERRLSRPGEPSEFNSALGVAAARGALEAAGRSADEVDQIVYATCTPDTPIPSTSCWLQAELGASRAWAMDVNAACAGFVFALVTAEQFVRSGAARVSLVIGADVLSSVTDWQDPTSCVLFGDAAGAVVVERAAADDPQRILASRLRTDGTLATLLAVEAGGSRLAAGPEQRQARLDKLHMRGSELFKVGVREMASLAEEVIAASGYAIEDVDWLIPHQANMRMIDAVAERLGLPREKLVTNIESCANSSAATIPTALDAAVRAGRIRSGDLVLLDAFGAGVTGGAVLLQW